MITVLFSLLPALILSLFGGILATWIHLVNRPDKQVEILAIRLSWLALFLYFVWMVIITLYQKQLPFVTVGQLAAFFGFLIWAAHLYIQQKVRQGILVVPPVITVIAMILISMVIGVQPVKTPDIFGSLWVSFHISFAIAGVALIQGAGIHGLGYLILHRQIKKRNFGPLFSLMPSLGDLDRLRTLALLTGWLLVSFGIIGGIIRMALRTEYLKLLTSHVGIAILFWVIISVMAAANRFRWLSHHKLSGFSVILSTFILVLIIISIIVTYPGATG